MNNTGKLDYQKKIGRIRGGDTTAMAAAQERQRRLLKPEGSLGQLERIAVRFAGITGKQRNRIQKRGLVLFGADNGVYEEGVATAPQSFTRSLMLHYAGIARCGINVICDANQVELKLVDVGIKGGVLHPRIDNRKLMEGTRNFAKGIPAVPRETAERAIQIGFDYAAWAEDAGFDILGNGEVGMGNTTTAAACIMAVLGLRDGSMVGTGAGLSPDRLRLKRRVILDALAVLKPDSDDGLDVLSKVGGLDIAAMTGLYLGAAYYRIPMVVDGLISIAAALLASRMQPLVKEFLFASHRSTEPAYRLAAEALGLRPILELDMRLGEGSGCPIAMGIIDTALAVMNTMCTFDETAVMESAAGMDQRHDGGWSVAGAGRYNTNIPADERGR